MLVCVCAFVFSLKACYICIYLSVLWFEFVRASLCMSCQLTLELHLLLCLHGACMILPCFAGVIADNRCNAPEVVADVGGFGAQTAQ